MDLFRESSELATIDAPPRIISHEKKLPDISYVVKTIQAAPRPSKNPPNPKPD